jgi:chemosensory pili system protein ChpB (putative protein-glutamate methylesterase)
VRHSAAIRIGIVSDCPLYLFDLQSVLVEAGYGIAIACSPDRLDAALLTRVAADAWLVSLSSQYDSGDLLAQLLDAEIPVLIDEAMVKEEGKQQAATWRARVLAKLDATTLLPVAGGPKGPMPGNPLLERAQATSLRHQPARNVWVLGASLGGPEALLEFVAHLPGDLPVSFVYAQHIDANFSGTLREVMSRSSGLTVHMLDEVELLVHGQLGIVPVAGSLVFKPLGKVVRSSEPWTGPFSPCINQVAEGVASIYRDCAGIIIFSGMGDDGAASCSMVRQHGGRVWAQEPASCICPAMPEAALASACVEYVAAPRSLAEALSAHYKNPMTTRSQY